MRRLATFCFPVLLCAVSAPALAANDGVITFTPPNVAAAESASVFTPAPTRGRYGGGFIEALLTGGAPQPGLETSAVEFFAEDALPELSAPRVTAAQIRRMFEHRRRPELPTDFD